MTRRHRWVWAAVLAAGAAAGAAAAEWTLVWADEFDGPEIDPARWEHEVNGWGGGNNELQYYTARPANAFIEDGRLVIRALAETYSGPRSEDDPTIVTRDYTSARLRTRFRGEWTYGRVEVRARMPRGRGLWPAAWMLPTDWRFGGWAASGEIDIMEYLGHDPERVYGTLHYGGQWPQNTQAGGSYVLPSGDFASGFHTFVLEWDPGVFRWLVDGVEFHTETSWWSTGAPYPAPFNQRFHLLLNLAVGGNWPGAPDGTTVFPQQLEVDYVRVYQRTVVPADPVPVAGSAPTRIEAEDYAAGGQGVGYHDTTAGNSGGAYRADDVDIEATFDSGGGFDVGWIGAGEWLAYRLAVERPGLYTVRIRAASPDGGGSLRLHGGPGDLGEPVAIPATGGWQDWVTVTLPGVSLPAGTWVLRAEAVTSGFNLNWLELEPLPSGLDTDGDGMPDAWEAAYSGSPTGLVAGEDIDRDGCSNLEEYVADTDPTRSASRLRLAVGTAAEPSLLQAAPASTARVYRLQVSPGGLDAPAWTDALTGIAPTGAVLTIPVTPAAAPQTFYRVGVEVPAGP